MYVVPPYNYYFFNWSFPGKVFYCNRLVLFHFREILAKFCLMHTWSNYYFFSPIKSFMFDKCNYVSFCEKKRHQHTHINAHKDTRFSLNILPTHEKPFVFKIPEYPLYTGIHRLENYKYSTVNTLQYIQIINASLQLNLNQITPKEIFTQSINNKFFCDAISSPYSQNQSPRNEFRPR